MLMKLPANRVKAIQRGRPSPAAHIPPSTASAIRFCISACRWFFDRQARQYTSCGYSRNWPAIKSHSGNPASIATRWAPRATKSSVLKKLRLRRFIRTSQCGCARVSGDREGGVIGK